MLPPSNCEEPIRGKYYLLLSFFTDFVNQELFDPMVREMLYPILLTALAAFTLLDALATVVGLKIGLMELNPLVMIWGVEFWVLFRILLLGGMLAVLFVGYRLCTKHFAKGVRIFETILFMLDLYIGAVVVSGFLTICMQLLS